MAHPDWEKFEKEGEEDVRKKFHQGLYGLPGSVKHILVKGWLDYKETQHADQNLAKAEAREEARDQFARDQARGAKTLSIIALVISAISVLASVILHFVR